MQRFRHAEPSWFFSGHTTSLLASETEKEPVSDVRGGIEVRVEVAGFFEWSLRLNGFQLCVHVVVTSARHKLELREA
jgi:hypothetical protein